MSEDKNPLGLSDEDFINLPIGAEEIKEEEAEVSEEEEAEVSEEEEVAAAAETNTEDDVTEEEEVDDVTEKDSASEEETKEPVSEDTVDDAGLDDKESDTKKVEDKKTDVSPAPKKEKDTSSDIDYKAKFEELMAPFKANGKSMKVDSVEDVRTLMQMGANYNKKMTGLKPYLKMVKTLEKNNLLDLDKINFLIDLDKKNPAAINKLVKDSGIDPLEIDIEKDAGYQPNSYTANDKEVALDDVLDSIEDSSSYKTTMDIIGNKWDASSQNLLFETPAIIAVINDQVASGVFDHITEVVNKERMLGRLTGLSDIEAYKQVGDVLKAQGAFNNPVADKTDKATVDAPKSVNNDKLNIRRKAASPTKKSPTKTSANDNYNPLSLSDAEFSKIANDKYI